MKYICVKWNHSFPDEPVILFSELDDARWEIRKVEIYRNGCKGYASTSATFGGTRLGLEPDPSLEEIASDPQFEPKEISREEFEQIWGNREMRDLAVA